MKRIAFAIFTCALIAAPIGAQEWGPWQPPAVAGQGVAQGGANVPSWIVAASVKVAVCMDQQRCWSGSGTIFHVDARRGLAFILTNHHVAPRDGARMTVTFSDGRTAGATFVCTETNPDISIVAIAGDASTPYVPLAEASPAAGTPVYQVGYPGGRGPACRAGVAQGPGGMAGGKFQSLNFRLNTTNGDSGSGIFRQSDGRLCAVLWGGSGPTLTTAVPVEYVHRMIAEVDQKYSVIVGVGIIRDRPPAAAPPSSPTSPSSPPWAGGPPVVTPIGPATPTTPLAPPDALAGIQQAIAGLQQDLASAKGTLPIHAKAISDLGGQLQQVNQTAAAALAKAGTAQAGASGVQTILGDVQGKLQQLPQLAGVVNDVQARLPQLATVISDVNSKVPQIAAEVKALGAAAGASSALPLIGAIGGPAGVGLGLAAFLLAAAAKKGATAPAPVTFQLPAGLAQLFPAGSGQQHPAA